MVPQDGVVRHHQTVGHLRGRDDGERFLKVLFEHFPDHEWGGTTVGQHGSAELPEPFTFSFFSWKKFNVDSSCALVSATEGAVLAFVGAAADVACGAGIHAVVVALYVSLPHGWEAATVCGALQKEVEKKVGLQFT